MAQWGLLMAELNDRIDTEEEFLLVLLALFAKHSEHDDEAEEELRNLLYYWLGLIFVRSAVQHGADPEQAEIAGVNWVLGHTARIASQMRRFSAELKAANQPVFPRWRAERIVSTEVTQAASAGSEFAAQLNGFKSDDDTWFTQLDERVCGFCGPLHGQPRGRWITIYYTQILPVHPEFAVYGPPERTPAHVSCRCFINYINGAGDGNS